MTTPNRLDDILTDDRIARMRGAVMAEVGADLDRVRRSRRHRTIGISAAAAVAVVAVGGGVLVGQAQDHAYGAVDVFALDELHHVEAAQARQIDVRALRWLLDGLSIEQPGHGTSGYQNVC